jgi:hypothetical protein
MASTTVGVQISTRERLIRWVARNMAQTGERLTFDEAINELLNIAEREEASR